MSKTEFLKNFFYLLSTIEIVFRIYKVYRIMLDDVNLTLLYSIQNSLPETHLQIQAAP